MSDGVAKHLCGCDYVSVINVFVNVLIGRISVVVVSVNSTIPQPGCPGRNSGCIVYVDRRSFVDMLIFKRRQYLPDLCNDLLYSGV